MRTTSVTTRTTTPNPDDTGHGPDDGRMTRQEFVRRLGAGLGAVLAASFVFRGGIPSMPREEGPVSGQRARPRLRADVRVSRDDGLYTMRLPAGGETITCAVNRAGEEIVRRLDGRHTIVQLSRAVAEAVRMEHTETMDATVACFVAQLSMMGFLRKEFRAFIIQREMV